MTILNHTGAAALQRSRFIAALERAGDDGVPRAEAREILGFHWQNRLVELRRRGFVIAEDKDVFVPVISPEVERAGGMGGDTEAGSSAASSLNPQPETLFPTSRPHFDDAREAA